MVVNNRLSKGHLPQKKAETEDMMEAIEKEKE